MKQWIGIFIVLIALTGCADLKAKIDGEKKAKALAKCLDFAKQESKDPHQHSKIINQCMETSGYYGFDYELQAK